ncbi:MAG TPA: cereblon family protein [Myxococcales bacterium]|nr:cereblon family protein [Myxococcales bacterium]
MRLLERAPPSGQERPDAAPADQRTGEDARAIRCRACGHAVTTSAERTSVAGAHEHTRFNPHGFVFRFGCFRAAPGCLGAGQPTAADSWFAGFLWSYALCGGCAEHLGWRFDGEASFHGLVLEKLVEDRE